ncbi:hypothetical protein FSP39_002856 [Pinctada imbricata]|uniref:Repulsive guidance molecule C-terminal domain-containing protein n=1 Tax=Pinctada imbricata TaxID=66713 RepID=A0AA88Y791_PINIB|nr:hypothetical protein FSP39_002856 [Pinctada imbricata]
MIKKNVDCAANEFKTYMAQTDHLPGTFSDGMTHYGPDRSVYLRVLEPGKNIEIYLRYIDTTIRVRQIGRYFTFAIKMPESIVDESRKLDEEQLCIQGCPKRERIDYQRFLAEKRKVALEKHGSIKMTREEASDLCRKEKVVDFYFDSCVFDLMTTGDTNFTMAAYQAWQDLIILSPEFVPRHQNRTDFKKYDDEIHSGSRRTTQSEYFWIIVLSVLICVYFRHTDS